MQPHPEKGSLSVHLPPSTQVTWVSGDPTPAATCSVLVSLLSTGLYCYFTSSLLIEQLSHVSALLWS